MIPALFGCARRGFVGGMLGALGIWAAGIGVGSAQAQPPSTGVSAFARQGAGAVEVSLPADPRTAIPLNLTLDQLRSWRVQAEARFQASKKKREAEYKGLSELHRKLFQVGSSVQAKRLESCGFDASVVSAKLAGDTTRERELTGKKASADQALKKLEGEFSSVVVALEKQANEMGRWLLEERRYEAQMRTLDERIYIMEVRKLAAGGMP